MKQHGTGSEAIDNAGQRTIVLAEDEDRLHMALARALRFASYKVVEALDGADALERIEDWSEVHALISDCRMPRMDGFELQQRVHQACPALPILLLSGDPDAEQRAAAQATHCRFVRKPIGIEALVNWLTQAVLP